MGVLGIIIVVVIKHDMQELCREATKIYRGKNLL
jgi:hypothetical protein